MHNSGVEEGGRERSAITYHVARSTLCIVRLEPDRSGTGLHAGEHHSNQGAFGVLSGTLPCSDLRARAYGWGDRWLGVEVLANQEPHHLRGKARAVFAFIGQVGRWLQNFGLGDDLRILAPK